MENQDKDWETEFSDSFTKKIPFPMNHFESGFINPADCKIMFTLSKANVHDDTNFQLYTDNQTATSLNEIVADLKEKKANAPRPPTPKEEEKKEEEKVAEGEGENEVIEVAEQPVVITASGDLTEHAISILEAKRAAERVDKQKEKDSKKEKATIQEHTTKRKESKGGKKEDLKKEDDKESEEGDSDQEKKKEVTETGKENVIFTKYETEETFGKNLKQCQSILTKWEIKSTGYRKIKELYIFDSISASLEFSKDGKYCMVTYNDSQTIAIYYTETMELFSKIKLEAKDENEQPITYFYGTLLSYDGSYIIAGDSYIRRIFDNKGKFIKNIKGRDLYTIFQYSKTQFVGFKNSDDTYTKSCLMAIDFINDTESIVHQFDSYISSGTFSDDMNNLMYEQYPKIIHINLKNKSEPKEVVKEYYSVYKYCFKGDKIAIVYSTNYYNLWVALMEDGVTKWKHKIEKSYIDLRSFVFADTEEDCLVGLEIENQQIKISYYEESFTTNY